MSRWTATVKIVLLLTVAAATPDWVVTAICLFFACRILGRLWEARP